MSRRDCLRRWSVSLGAVLVAFGCGGDLIAPDGTGDVYELVGVEGESLPLTVIDLPVFTMEGESRYRVLLHHAEVLLRRNTTALVATETQIVSATLDSTWVSEAPYRWTVVQDTLIELCTAFSDPLLPDTCGYGRWRETEFSLRGSFAFGSDPDFLFRFVRR